MSVIFYWLCSVVLRVISDYMVTLLRLYTESIHDMTEKLVFNLLVIDIWSYNGNEQTF